jgi:hypothetical protein
MSVTRRVFLGWAGFTGYGVATLVRPPHAHAGPKKRVFPGVASAAGVAFDATVTTGGGLYHDSYGVV